MVCLILNLSLNGIMTDVGKFTLFPFKVIMIHFQSISVKSQIILFFYSLCSGATFPVILNRCMLPAALPNFTGM